MDSLPRFPLPVTLNVLRDHSKPMRALISVPSALLPKPHTPTRHDMFDLDLPAKLLLPHVLHERRDDQVGDPLLGDVEELQVGERLDEEIEVHLYEDSEGRGGLEEGDVEWADVFEGWRYETARGGIGDLVCVSDVLMDWVRTR